MRRPLPPLALACLLAASGAAAQPRPQAEEEAMRLVVMIRATLDGTERVGAGIVVGAANDRLYVVTANHVVREGPLTATDVTVQLRALPGERVPARLLDDHDAGMDVAVLSVPGLAALGLDPAALTFDRLGDPAALRRGDLVRALGYPQGNPWSVNVRPDPVAAATDSVLTFESAFVGVGHSGGALLDEQWRLVGLLQTVQPPEATALRLDVVLDRLRGWRYPVALRRRFDAATLETVSAGAGFTCAIGAGGRASCWGRNDAGELGTGTSVGATTPTPVHGELAFATISAGTWFACGVTLDGIAYCWGNDGPGLTLAGTTEARATPTPVLGGLTVAAVSAGNGSTCAVTTAHRAYCWGRNSSGELGDGSTRASPRPVAVAGDLAFASVSTGTGYACGVTTDGVGYCWGDNGRGQLGDGTEESTTRPTRIAGDVRFRVLSADRTPGRPVTCGVALDGTAYCWGWLLGPIGRHVRDRDDEMRPGPVYTDVRFRTVSVAGHACGLSVDGDVYCWGSNRYGQLGDGAAGEDEGRIVPRPVPRRP